MRRSKCHHAHLIVRDHFRYFLHQQCLDWMLIFLPSHSWGFLFHCIQHPIEIEIILWIWMPEWCWWWWWWWLWWGEYKPFSFVRSFFFGLNKKWKQRTEDTEELERKKFTNDVHCVHTFIKVCRSLVLADWKNVRVSEKGNKDNVNSITVRVCVCVPVVCVVDVYVCVHLVLFSASFYPSCLLLFFNNFFNQFSRIDMGTWIEPSLVWTCFM